MRAALLASTLLLAPALASAQVCPASAEATPPQSPPASPPTSPPPPPAPAPTRAELAAFPEIPAAEIARSPTLAAVASRGATLRDMGGDTGPFRLVFAHTADRFEVFTVLRSDPRWVVRGGALLDYAAANPADRNVTLQRARLVPGLVPSVDMRQAQQPSPEDGNATLARIEREAAFGTIGPDGAPRLWVFFDPRCPFSKAALAALRPEAEAGRIQVAMIPVPLLGGQSAQIAAGLLGLPADKLDAAWAAGSPPAPTPEGTAKAEQNEALAHALMVQYSPTLVWRQPDGTPQARIWDSKPEAVLASLGVQR